MRKNRQHAPFASVEDIEALLSEATANQRAAIEKALAETVRLEAMASAEEDRAAPPCRAGKESF